MKTASYERFGGLCAIIAGAGGLGYSTFFVILSRSAPEVSNVFESFVLDARRISPLWYIWLGLVLWRGPKAQHS